VHVPVATAASRVRPAPLTRHPLAEDIDAGCSPSTSMLSEAAQAYGVTLVGGSVPERSNGKLYNTCCVYDNTGKLLAKHRCVRMSPAVVQHTLVHKVALRTVLLGSTLQLATGREHAGEAFVIRGSETGDCSHELYAGNALLYRTLKRCRCWHAASDAPTSCCVACNTGRCTCSTSTSLAR
jgi:hypothetical protein